MEIGKKLKDARTAAGLTQEKVAAEIFVSRQTISNWENEKSYPDIISAIKLSDLYQISLDVLLKGDTDMLQHLEESTNFVKSNKVLVIAVITNAMLMLAFFIGTVFVPLIPGYKLVLASGLIFFVITTALIISRIIKHF